MTEKKRSRVLPYILFSLSLSAGALSHPALADSFDDDFDDEASYSDAQAESPAPLQRLMTINKGNSLVDALDSGSTKNVRLKAMQEAANTLGMQTGAKWRYDQINAILEKHAEKLDDIYSFKPYLLNDGLVFPPVIDAAQNAVKIKVTDNEIIMSDQVYRIRRAAHVISAPPSWRQYLIQKMQVVERVNESILPKNDEERAMWQANVQSGWTRGIAYANQVFELGLRRLESDIRGVQTFSMLARQHIISMPMLARGDFGIQVNGKKLDIGQTKFKITGQAAFNSNGHEWISLGFSDKK